MVMNPPPDLSTVPDSHDQTLQRLVSRAVSQNELASLVETVFSNKKVTDTVDRLQGSDIQTFIDVIDEALDSPNFSPRIRGKCVTSLYKMCAGHSLLPRSLQIQACYDLSGIAHCRGGFADVWKGTYGDREVAVKALRIYANSDLQKITRRFCKEFLVWKALNHPNVLPLLGVEMTETWFAMVSEWMTDGNINQFVANHWDANRFALLGDVAKGLSYMHDQGMVHGDLKGANILVDQSHHARLADFGLLTILSDSETSTSFPLGGTTRWMSPELFDPDVRGNRRTKRSDCYALGMVIYEVLSGRLPFYQYENFVVPLKVFQGSRPERPDGLEGVWFKDDVWAVLKRCWASQPNERPTIKDVLQCLEEASRVWTPPSPPAVAIPAVTNSPTWNPFDITPNTDGGEASHPLSAANFLRKVADWDGNSPDIDQTLAAAFEADDYLDCIKDLKAQNIEPLSYVNGLDKIIDSFPTDSELRRRCVRALRKTCGLHRVLPTSHVVTFTFSQLPERPFASGGFSDIWKLTDEERHDRIFAVKSFRVYEQDHIEEIIKRYCKEVIVLKRANHPNILSIEGVAPNLFELCMVSRWMPNGNILEYITKQPEINRLELLVGITCGLDYLHNNKIVHGDLKASNVLIDAKGCPHLSDFACSSITKNIYSANASTPNRDSTVRYCAPELLDAGTALRVEKRKPTKKSDIYSLSMVIVEVATGRKPFPELTDAMVTIVISKGKRPSKPPRFNTPGMTPTIWKIAEKCWHRKAKKRPEANAVLKHLEKLANPGVCTHEFEACSYLG